MYSTKTATINNNEFNSSYMPVGINENVWLKEVNVNKSPTGKDFLEFIFENEAGQTVTVSEWKNEKGLWVKTDEDLQTRDNQQFGRILQIIDAVVGSHGDFEGNSFIEMINWAKAQIGLAKEGDAVMRHLVRLKVIYDKKGYTTVSRYGVFIEPISVAKEESQIKLFKSDLLERPVQPDKEDDPLAAGSSSIPVTAGSTGADDLPF